MDGEIDGPNGMEGGWDYFQSIHIPTGDLDISQKSAIYCCYEQNSHLLDSGNGYVILRPFPNMS